MRLVFKGKFKGINTLPKGNLPEHATKFKEPSTTLKMNLVAALFTIPTLIIIFVFLAVKIVLSETPEDLIKTNYWGYLFALLCIIPHELLHAVCFPKNAEVEIYFSNWGAFVVSTYPISKLRFILLSLCPNLVFGVLPLVIWLFLPNGLQITHFIYSFGFLSMLGGCGDYMNVYNAFRQMPKGTYQQLSGFNSYWFYPRV